ncbi:MAG: FkbM family methyltransferase [Myxococcales bacterium]|nr:FkbM family methyltransferase [Myxococcales bacterium]
MSRLRELVRRFRPSHEATAHLAADILGKRSSTVLDVGARWGVDEAWYALDPLARVVGFEPDPVECARLNATIGASDKRDAATFVPVALGGSKGQAQLHVTREPGCSSLLPPNRALVARYPALDVMSPVSSLSVEVTTLAEWANERGSTDVAFMKLDVQGAELDVLRGAGATLDRCVGLELEVEFMPLYEGQPLFGDLDVFLRARGFSLWRISHLVHYAERHRDTLEREESAAYDNVHVTAKAGAGRLAWGHAIYLRDFASLPDTPLLLRELLELASLLDAMGESDGAAAALETALSRRASELGAAHSRVQAQISALRS